MPFAIGIENPKTPTNVGTAMRSAYNFGASLVFIVGKRYKKQPSDTTKTFRHIPLLHFDSWDDYAKHAVYKWPHYSVDLLPNAFSLPGFVHPKSAVYLFGPEDGTISPRAQEFCKGSIVIPSRYCLNLAVAASIIMYDRAAKKTYIINLNNQRRRNDGIR